MSKDYALPRPDSIYLSWPVKRALTMLARARDVTPDDIAGTVLLEWLTREHPDVLKHIEAMREADDKFQSSLKDRLADEPRSATGAGEYR